MLQRACLRVPGPAGAASKRRLHGGPAYGDARNQPSADGKAGPTKEVMMRPTHKDAKHYGERRRQPRERPRVDHTAMRHEADTPVADARHAPGTRRGRAMEPFPGRSAASGWR